MKDSLIAIAIGSAVVLLALLSLWLGLFSGIEYRIQDRFFSERPIDDRLLIVAIDDTSLAELGQWPLPRTVYTELFKKLEVAQPLAVGFDVMLAEPSRLGQNDDASLEKALQQISYPLIFPIEGRKEASALSPLSQFTDSPQVHLGHVNLTIDPDSVVRSLPAQIFTNTTDNTTHISFAEQVIAYSGITYQPFKDTQQRIMYADEPNSIPRISLSEALTAPNATFANKLIFIGATAPDLHDEQAVPVSRGVLMPGVGIQANIANQLIHGWRLTPLPYFYTLLWLFCAALLPVLLYTLTRTLRIIIPALILLFVLHGITALTLFESGITSPLLHILFVAVISPLALFVWQYTIGEYERRQLKHAFGKYVSPQVLTEILAHPEMVSLGGEKREVTVLFSDIRSFTTLSEQTTPEELVDILNDYFTEMTDAILEEGGVLDKYIGDAIMAFWGAPLPDPDQADAAVRASKQMVQRLESLNARLKKDGKPIIANGIGLYTGPAIAGNIGSEKRFDYTVIGDTVNVASRLEGLTKGYETTLIIGESTKDALTDTTGVTYLDETQVKGREKPLKIYSVAV